MKLAFGRIKSGSICILLTSLAEPLISVQSTEKRFEVTVAQSQKDRWSTRIFLSIWPLIIGIFWSHLLSNRSSRLFFYFVMISSLINRYAAFQMCAPSFSIIIFHILYVRLIVNRTTRCRFTLKWLWLILHGRSITRRNQFHSAFMNWMGFVIGHFMTKSHPLFYVNIFNFIHLKFAHS